MPGQANDSSPIQDEGGNRDRIDEAGPGAGDPRSEEFLAALQPIWDVPVEETGMAVTFDALPDA